MHLDRNIKRKRTNFSAYFLSSWDEQSNCSAFIVIINERVTKRVGIIIVVFLSWLIRSEWFSSVVLSIWETQGETHVITTSHHKQWFITFLKCILYPRLGIPWYAHVYILTLVSRFPDFDFKIAQKKSDYRLIRFIFLEIVSTNFGTKFKRVGCLKNWNLI